LKYFFLQVKQKYSPQKIWVKIVGKNMGKNLFRVRLILRA